jgi:hypothetical protein
VREEGSGDEEGLVRRLRAGDGQAFEEMVRANGNLGLVKDVREVRLPAGMLEVQFMDVASQIDPTTVHLKSLTDPAGVKILEQNFEYHLYTLDGRTTIKDNQTKQLSLLSATEGPVQKQLLYYGAEEYYRNAYGMPISTQKVQVYLELRNSKENRLGLPLPKGKVRVYKADTSGSQQFIGEDWIDHTPKDERVKIKMGNAFDVVAERTQKDWRKIASGLYEVEWEVALRNHKKQEQTVTVIEPVPGDWQVLHATHRGDKVEAHTLRFRVPVAPEGAAKLTYRVRLRF